MGETWRILFVGDLREGWQFRQRRDALREMGYQVTSVSTVGPAEVPRMKRFASRVGFKLFRMGVGRFSLRELNGENDLILRYLQESPQDVLWLDRAVTVEAETLHAARQLQPRCVIAGYGNDDMAARHNQSRQFLEHLPLYDVYFTTKSYNVAELESLGCRRCVFIRKGFDPNLHRPVPVTAEDRHRLGGPVGFVGAWESDRARSLFHVAESGVPVRIWGGGWQRCRSPHPAWKLGYRDVLGEEYTRTLCSLEIALCFLRKMNRDRHTARSIEIPACGVFMLAERTEEHQGLFEEGREAEFFGSDAELLDKIRFYLAHPQARERIAQAGRRRCLESGYRHHDRLRQMFDVLREVRAAKALGSDDRDASARAGTTPPSAATTGGSLAPPIPPTSTNRHRL